MTRRIPLLALALSVTACAYTPGGSDPAHPRIKIPRGDVDEPLFDVEGKTGPERRVEVYVNGHPRTSVVADSEGDFLFERVSLHPGLNIIRVVLVPTDEEILAQRGATLEEHEYEPPPYAEVRVAFVRRPEDRP